MRNRCLRAILPSLALAAVLAGCATEPPKDTRHTTVVLLPDDDGQVGALTLSAAGASQDLRQAWQASTVQGRGSAPSPAQAVDPTAVQGRHAALLQAQPAAAVTLVVYFLVDKAVLTEESKAMLPAALKAIRERNPTEITVFGHADASGSRDRNLRLSAERAQAVADWLRAADPRLEQISVQYFGDSKPQPGSDAQANPARNRRAEIQIL